MTERRRKRGSAGPFLLGMIVYALIFAAALALFFTAKTVFLQKTAVIINSAVITQNLTSLFVPVQKLCPNLLSADLFFSKCTI